MVVTWRIILLGLLIVAVFIPIRFRYLLVYCIRLADEHAGFMTFLATVAIAILTYFLVTISDSQWHTTQDALNETRIEFASTQRPNIALGNKEGVVAEFIAPQSSDEKASIKLLFQNGGQAPALTPNVGLLTAIIIPPDMKAYGLKVPPFTHLLRSNKGVNGTVGSISPQSQFSYFARDILTADQYESVRNGIDLLDMVGMIEYCDDRGKYSCMEFMIDSTGPPPGTFNEWTDTDCGLMYAYPPRRPDETYLPPCEQPHERDAREKSEESNIANLAGAAPTISPTPSPKS